MKQPKKSLTRMSKKAQTSPDHNEGSVSNPEGAYIHVSQQVEHGDVIGIRLDELGSEVPIDVEQNITKIGKKGTIHGIRLDEL